MGKKNDVPMFRVASFILCLLGVVTLISNIPSVENIVGFIKNPVVTEQSSAMSLYYLLDALATGGPFFIGFAVCGFLGFLWRGDMGKAKWCLILGGVTLGIQVLTMAAAMVFLHGMLPALNAVTGGTAGFYTVRALASYIPGYLLLALFVAGALKMKKQQ